MRFIILSFIFVACTVQVSPNPGPVSKSSPSPTPSGSSSQQQQLGCDETDTQCNCAYTQAYPGYVERTTNCQSGYHAYATCGQCQGGGSSWYTYCYCQ